MTRLTTSRLEQFRVVLHGMRREREASTRRLRAEIVQCGEMRRVGDSLDDAQDVESMSTTAELNEANVRALRDIARAIDRIDARTFGICSDCNGAIADKRLNANPLAIRCRDCQVAVESESQRTRHVPVYP